MIRDLLASQPWWYWLACGTGVAIGIWFVPVAVWVVSGGWGR